MTRTSNIVPTSYDELFRHYFPYVKAMVLKYKVPYEVHEDVAMTLLAKFIENDMLGQFDSERVGNTGKPVQFSSFLSGFIVAYVRYHAQKAHKAVDIERQYIDEPVYTDPNDATPWLDDRGFKHEDDLSGIEYDMLVHTIRLHLARIPVKRKKNFLLLFDLVLDQMEERGRIHIRELATLFEVSEPLVQSWMKELRKHIKKAQA